MSADTIRFGAFELNPRVGELRQDGRTVKLQPQPMKMLVLLAQRAGEVVTREELQAAVWGSDIVVDYDNGLNWSIRKIRETLGDDPLHPRFIETVPRKGYRFIAAVTSATPEADPRAEARGLMQPSTLRVAVTLMVCLVSIGGAYLQQRARPTTIVVLPFDNLTGNTGQDFLATAATDQVITGVGSRGGLNVIDRMTAAKLKRSEECIIRIGEQLRADFVVEGSLVGPADAPLITAGIYRVHDNTKLWAGQMPIGPDRGMSASRLIAAKVGAIAE